MVSSRKPAAQIVLGNDPTFIETLAAKELAKYIRLMTNVKLETLTGNSQINSDNLVVIGRAETNSVISELIDAGKIRMDENYPGDDGFFIRTVNAQVPFSTGKK